jgi:hypothetical protein
MSNAYDQLFDEVIGSAVKLDDAEGLYGDDLVRHVLKEVVQSRAESARMLRDIRQVAAATLAVTVAVAVKLFMGF